MFVLNPSQDAKDNHEDNTEKFWEGVKKIETECKKARVNKQRHSKKELFVLDPSKDKKDLII